MADRVLVELSYDIQVKWRMTKMPRWAKIYVVLWDHHRARFPENPKARFHIQMMKRCALVVSAKHAQWWSCVSDFSRIHWEGWSKNVLKNLNWSWFKVPNEKVALVQNLISSPSMKVIWTWYFQIVRLILRRMGGSGGFPPRETTRGKNKIPGILI